MTIAAVFQRRGAAMAFLDRNRTTARKATPGWQVYRAWRISRQGYPFFRTIPWTSLRHGGKQGLCVGMLWIGKKRNAIRLFNYLTEVHDSDMITEMLNNSEIMADKQVR